jgi:hypothetical protein
MFRCEKHRNMWDPFKVNFKLVGEKNCDNYQLNLYT